MKIAVYAGSFDPFTFGHLDILKQSLEIFDKVIIGVAYNHEKTSLLSPEERVEIIKLCTKDFTNIKVFSYEGLTVNFAKKHNANVLIRGLRNTSDFEYENQLAQINASLDKNTQTVFLVSKPEYSMISSSCVKELILHKCDLSGFLPEKAKKYLYKKFGY